MSEALKLLGSFALTTSAAVAAALLLCQALRTRASAKSAYAAWLVVLLAVLIPFKLEIAPVTVTLKEEYVAAVTQPIAETQRAEVILPQQSPVSGGYLPLWEGESVSPAMTRTAHTPKTAITWEMVLLAVYTAGVLAAAVWQATRHLRYMRLVKRWQRPVENENTLALYDELSQGMRVKPKLCLCGAAESPMVVGLMHPRILLPDTHLSLSELRLVLRHELTHYRRGDLWVKLLQTAALCLHWYNPLMYLMNREMNYACEASCDERVMKGQDLDTREYYSETIIAVIRRQTRARTALSTTFYGGKKGMKKRILSIMDMKRRRLGALILCPVLLVTLIFSVAFATEMPKSTNEPAPETDSFAALFDEAGEIMDKAMAEQRAIEHYLGYRETGREKAMVLDAYEVKDVTYGRLKLETAVVDLKVTFEHDGNLSDGIFRIWMTPREGKLVRLTNVSRYEDGREIIAALAYYDHPLNFYGAETLALQETMPRSAIINNPVAATANMSNQKTDYDWPQGVFFNGVPVKVLQVAHEGNNCRMLSDAATIYWAEVQVGTITGWMPLSTMTFEDELIGDIAALPVGTVAASGSTGHVSLYDACSHANVITSVANGTQVELMGFFAEYYQVRLDSKTTGFIRKENLQLSEDVLAMIAENTPKNFDEIQPGGEEAHEAYMNAIQELWDKYGDSNTWPLEVSARASQIRMDYGFDLDLSVNILPGENDMSEEAARKLANELIEKEFGVPVSDYVRVDESLYYKPEAPEKHIWKFRYYARVGGYDCWVEFDQQGNVIAIAQSEQQQISMYSDLEELLTDAGWYYRNGVPVGDMPEDEEAALIDAAWAEFEKAYPDPITREECEIYCYLMRDGSGELSADARWKLVTFTPIWNKDSTADAIAYSYVYVDVDGEIYHTDAEDYQKLIKAERYQADLRALEAERGKRHYAWSVEEKAAFASEHGEKDYAVPTDDVISQQQAYAAALDVLVKAVGETAAKEYHAFFSYALWQNNEANPYYWRVDFYTPDVMVEDATLDGYIIWVHPETGEVVDVWLPGGNG